MKTIMSTTLAGLMLIGSAIASAAGEGQGVVASIDPVTRTIVLEDGSAWQAADTVDIEALAPGDAIAVVYEDGTTILTEVTKVE